MDTNEEERVAACCVLIACALKIKKKGRRKGNVWVKPWLQARSERALYSSLVEELKLADKGDYRRFMRMNTETFEVIL